MVGNRTRPARYTTLAVVLGLLLVAWNGVSPVSGSGNPVGEIVADIASLRPAQGSDCQAVISAVQGGGIVEQKINGAFGTNFEPITIDSSECSLLLAFVPMVGSYNDGITAAKQYDPNNSTSVTNFYEKAFILAAEVTIVGFALDGTLYKASFHATGELNDALKLGKLRSLCGDACYRDVLSAIYWFINGTASSALDDFLSWAVPYLPSSVTDNLPRPSQITAFHLDQVSLLSFAAFAILISFFFIRRRT